MKPMKSRFDIPQWIGRLALWLGVLNVVANIFRRFQPVAHRVDKVIPGLVNSTAFSTALFTSLVLILVASGLRRRKRRAWTIAVIVLAFNLLSDFFRYHYHPLQIIPNAVLLVILLIVRKEFYAISDPATKFQPLYAFAILLSFTIISAIMMLYFRHGHDIVGNPSFKNIFLTVIEGMVGISGPIEFVNQRASDAVEFSLAALGIFTIVLPLFLYFRRVKPLPKMSDEDIEIVRKLIRHDVDQDSLGYFATRRDKSVIWAPNKKAGIAYRVEAGVMLASGDPFGEYSLWPAAIDAFLEEAKLHAWTPAVMGASDRGGEVWVEHAGMTAFDIGDEAIIKVKDFTLEGRPMANVRQMVNRIGRKGYVAKTTKWSDLDLSIRVELRGLAKKWRYGTPERGFSMSMDRFGEDIDGETVITIATLGDEIKGLLYFVPWSNDGISLDRMQRERGTDPGVNELLIVQTVEWARENKIESISLNFAAFRSLFERADKISAGPITRGSRNVIRFFSNFFQVESLYRFNAKFDPEWQTRYLVYPKATDIAKIGWAAIKAEQFIGSFRKKAVKG
jgi:lysyl-tRNA synthetase class 2